MKLIEYHSEVKKKLIEFNIQNYPNRTKVQQRIEHLLNYKCNGLPIKIYLGVDEDKIIGQIFLLPFFVQNTEEVHYWGMDYFVHSDYRNTPIGIMLLRKVLKKNAHLGMAFSPISLKIHKVLGEKQIADLKLFVKPNFAYIIRLFNNGQLPKFIKVKDETFHLVNNISFNEKNNISNPKLILRNKDTLSWRFNAFDNRRYYKYQSEDELSYIVLRQIVLKKIPMLLVVDYRLSIYNKASFEIIDNLISKVVKRTGCFGVLFYNSISDFDLQLKRSLYFKLKNIPILSNRPLKNLLVTPADSDFELNM